MLYYIYTHTINHGETYIVLESYGKNGHENQLKHWFFDVFCGPVGATGVDSGVNLGDSYAAGRDGGTWEILGGGRSADF
jgi:hypothetical protein